MRIFDTSALVAYLRGEEGQEPVASLLSHRDCAMSAVQWLELRSLADRDGLDVERLAPLLDIVPLDKTAADHATLFLAPDISLGDRCCLGTGVSLGTTGTPAEVITADQAWAALDVRSPRITIVQIR